MPVFLVLWGGPIPADYCSAIQVVGYRSFESLSLTCIILRIIDEPDRRLIVEISPFRCSLPIVLVTSIGDSRFDILTRVM